MCVWVFVCVLLLLLFFGGLTLSFVVVVFVVVAVLLLLLLLYLFGLKKKLKAVLHETVHLLFSNIVTPQLHKGLHGSLQCRDAGLEKGLVLLVLTCRCRCNNGASVVKCAPARCFFGYGIRWKSDDARSGEYGGWSISPKPQ